MLTRRVFAGAVPALLTACTDSGVEGYEAVATRIWSLGPLRGLEGVELGRELVRYATLAPSSHNTQCWLFEIRPGAITIRPDRSRRCPVVDPDDHHLYVSLGCAAENLMQAAQAWGLAGETRFDERDDAVRIELVPAVARTTPLFQAIVQRQSTRVEYDGQPLANGELRQLEQAGRSERVRLLLLTDRPARERVLEFVIQGNTAQMNDPAFRDELKRWIRFSGVDAVRLGDGLFGKASGNPEVPGWLGDWVFDWVFTAQTENDKYARQLRSSAGVAVFAAAREDKAHWVEVGRCYERFALQAAALGIRQAHLNMPVEVPALRPSFAQAIGLGGQRPDLVVRFGRGPLLPRSLRRPVSAVLV